MFVRIAFTWNLAEAGRIQSLLESGGYHPARVDTSSNVTVAGAEQGYDVEVPETEANAAIDFLKQEGLSKCLVR